MNDVDLTSERMREADKIIGNALRAVVNRGRFRGPDVIINKNDIDAFIDYLLSVGVDVAALDAVLTGGEIFLP